MALGNRLVYNARDKGRKLRAVKTTAFLLPQRLSSTEVTGKWAPGGQGPEMQGEGEGEGGRASTVQEGSARPATTPWGRCGVASAQSTESRGRGDVVIWGPMVTLRAASPLCLVITLFLWIKQGSPGSDDHTSGIPGPLLEIQCRSK